MDTIQNYHNPAPNGKLQSTPIILLEHRHPYSFDHLGYLHYDCITDFITLDEQSATSWNGQVDYEGKPHGNGMIIHQHEAYQTFLVDGMKNGLTKHYQLNVPHDISNKYCDWECSYKNDQLHGLKKSKYVNGVEGDYEYSFFVNGRPKEVDKAVKDNDPIYEIVNTCTMKKVTSGCIGASNDLYLMNGLIKSLTITSGAMGNVNNFVIQCFGNLEVLKCVKDSVGIDREVNGGLFSVKYCPKLKTLTIEQGCFARYCVWELEGRYDDDYYFTFHFISIQYHI